MKRILLGIGLLAALGGLLIWASTLGPRQYTPTEVQSSTVLVSAEIDGVMEAQDYAVHEGTTVLGLLEHQSELHGFALETEDYGEMGVLVTTIGEFANGTDQKYWQYQVNGEMPLIGADRLELNDGDHVQWVFTRSEY